MTIMELLDRLDGAGLVITDDDTVKATLVTLGVSLSEDVPTDGGNG